MKLTLYQILGIDSSASADDVAAAYARLAAKGDWTDPNMPSLLRQANEVLADPKRRLAYDASLAGPIARTSPMPESDAGGAFVEKWGKWIVAAALVAGLTWWGTRRTSTPPETPAPPQIARPAPLPPIARRMPAAVQPPLSVAADAPAAAPPSSSVAANDAPARTPSAAPSTAARSAEDVFADVAPSVARVNVMDAGGRVVATGSGVVIEPGVMLTSCHVATIGAKLSVKLGDAVLPAALQVADEVFDLCRLSVDGMRAPALTLAGVDTLRTGQRVYAIGAPQGLELTISEGIVSALRKVDDGTIIQTTAPISPGSSGGGLFDLSGRLVGIMTFQHRYGQNLNFALPADWIGQMRARRSSDARLQQAVAAQLAGGATQTTLILGRWLCRDWLSGRTATFSFGTDGRVQLSLPDSQAGTLSYGISGKALQLFDAKQGMQFTIEELTARKMVLHGREKSIACERE
jgi:hypothetical protein